MSGESSEYDVFLSYAQTDNRESDRYVDHLVATMRRVYSERTGRELRVFQDHTEVVTSQMWERRIRAALRHSSIMIPVLSPAYFESRWCALEWDSFLDMGRERSITYGITPYLNLIFPVTLRRWTSRNQRSGQVRRRVQQAQAMQYVDFTGVPRGTGRFTELVTDLVDDLAEVLEDLEAVVPGYAAPPEGALLAASPESPMITTRRAGDRAQFIKVLSAAVNVTIIGITNENLSGFLDEALKRKQRRLGPHAFWEKLEIVFLREDLLHLVNDELEAQRTRTRDTFRERKLRAKLGKLAVVAFLTAQNQPGRWTLHQYKYYLPFHGVLFGMPDGTDLVQLALNRPRQSAPDALYFEFVDLADQYFTNAFHGVVADSEEVNEAVLVGTPDDSDTFHVNGARFRGDALQENKNAHDWLPSVVAATWRVRSGVRVPVLQVRTDSNATQYIHHVSHISGYINVSDFPPGDHTDFRSGSPGALAAAARNAVRRELLDQLGLEVSEDQLDLFRTCHFNNHDRENLFFHLFSLQIPASYLFPNGSGLRDWSITELIELHKHQVFRKAALLLRQEGLSGTQRRDAAQILAWQLQLHGEHEVAEQLVRSAQRPADSLVGQLRRTADQYAVRLRVSGQETVLRGLAEIHYREFFATLLPLYAQAGVPEAEQAIARLGTLDGAGEARARLIEAHRDDNLLSSLPFEV
jgi:hypothetical protein